ncbi:MAG TPA: aminotransferase class IV family protein [Bacteroidia bacterium]|nr:aminotransferase class IV family protein [Bacteroidia bacterium]
MYLLIESIKVVDGQLQNIAYHNKRFNRGRRELWNCKDDLDIKTIVKVPSGATKGLYKCTVSYNTGIVNVQFQVYNIRKIASLKIITANDIDYSYKYADRNSLNKLFAQRENCDEILIVKNQLITDTSFSNIVFFDGDKWFTPDTPLLKGTKREKLLHEGLIKEASLKLDDLRNFNRASLINAMLDIGDSTIDVKNLK